MKEIKYNSRFIYFKIVKSPMGGIPDFCIRIWKIIIYLFAGRRSRIFIIEFNNKQIFRIQKPQIP